MHVRLRQLQQHLPHSRPASCSLRWAYGTHSSGQRQRMLLALMLMMLLLTDHLPAMPAMPPGAGAWLRPCWAIAAGRPALPLLAGLLPLSYTHAACGLLCQGPHAGT